MKKSQKMILFIIGGIFLLAILGALGYFIYLKNAFISKEQVKEIVISDTKLNKDDISFKEIDLDLEEGTKKYDVEFYYNRVEYNYEIDAKTGKVIYSNYNQNNENNSYTNNQTSDTNSSTKITTEEAKNIALTDAGFTSSEVNFVDVDSDLENGKAIYEVDFEINHLEYDYKIDGFSKNIISKKTEPRD